MKKVLSLMMSLALFLNSISSITVRAEEKNLLIEDVVIATNLLNEVFDEAYKKIEEDVQSAIVEGEYDYDLTMETFYTQGNPFSNIDYVGIICAYITCSNHTYVRGISELPFLKVEMIPTQIEEYIPEKVEIYELLPNGYYRYQETRYISQEVTVPVYTKNANGFYELSGEKLISPVLEKVPYLEVNLSCITPEKVFAYYNLDMNIYRQEYDRRVQIITSGVSADALAQINDVNFGIDNVDMEAVSNYLLVAKEASKNRQRIIDTAISLLGNVPYEWGGKSRKAGYDNAWWTFTETGNQKGLDCSGYVQWVYRTAGISEDIWKQIGSTAQTLQFCTEIDETELQVGDLGLLNRGEKVNHVGIYLGNGYWIHCSAEGGTVVINDFDFKIFMRIDGLDECTMTQQNVKQLEKLEYSEEEIYHLAQVVSYTSGYEGLNGWVVALQNIVGEVLENNSTLEEYLADAEYNKMEIQNMVPLEEMLIATRMVCEGRLRVETNVEEEKE